MGSMGCEKTENAPAPARHTRRYFVRTVIFSSLNHQTLKNKRFAGCVPTIFLPISADKEGILLMRGSCPRVSGEEKSSPLSFTSLCA